MVALAALACAPAADALAAFTVTVGQAAPADPAIGAHFDVTTSVSFAGGDVRDLVLSLPPGLVGNPNATARCPAATFAAGQCDAGTKVGRVSAQTVAVGVPLPVDGDVYNVEPQAGELARLGLVLRVAGGLLGSIQQPVSITARAPGDYGLNATATGIAHQFAGIDIDLQTLTLTLFGGANGQPGRQRQDEIAHVTAGEAHRRRDVGVADRRVRRRRLSQRPSR